MKKLQVLAVALICFSGLKAQESQTLQVDFNSASDLKMETEYSSDNYELSDILDFEGIDYMKVNFTGKQLKGKAYKITVKEIWNGKVKSESVVVDSKNLGLPQFATLKTEEFKMRVLSKHTKDNKLQMKFKFPRFSTNVEYKAIKSNDYSLRNIADESELELKYNEAFYLLAYILPYEREDGSKSWCEVGTSGKNLENWGKKFGIKHYLLFEMKFE
ncbi:hypothetical protein BTO05_12730 [Winogradskyella sp. PC-19]|uniref:hypothetical protein n=1 Tax=unclassified Winogradskyella TaxID=2615021 RepID=UPI000B3C7AEE|nr:MULTISPECIES: hypothetical protein [unclassified Winogradskyella]ARV10456.1 hypothetical protein BTO05_12730 [Winogradskyella sp. PC-19]